METSKKIIRNNLLEGLLECLGTLIGVEYKEWEDSTDDIFTNIKGVYRKIIVMSVAKTPEEYLKLWHKENLTTDDISSCFKKNDTRKHEKLNAIKAYLSFEKGLLCIIEKNAND